MKEHASQLLTYYHVIMMQIRSRFHQENELGIDDLIEEYQHYKAYKKLVKIAHKEDLDLIHRFVEHDIRALVHNRDSSIADQSVLLLMLKEHLWHLLFQSADQTQLRLYEMLHDIDAEGQYYEGEFVVGGLVECRHCGLVHKYDHLHEITACERCGSHRFERPRHFPRKIDVKSNYRY